MATGQAPLNNWQQHLKTWPERIYHIKQNDKLTDFRFIVGPEKTVFHAHKLIFAISSPEFENLFYLLESNMKEIVLPGTPAEIFEDFIDFIYTGELELTSETVEGMLKLSKLYSITLLSRMCESFLEENVDEENVLTFLDLSTDYELLKAMSECLKIIDENSKEIFESQEFVEISKKSLEKIVEFEMLSCEEIQVFKAVDKWSENACEMNQIELTSENKRVAIGDIVLKIRFSAMSMEEFSMCCNTNITLTDKEIAKIIKSIKDHSQSGFNLKKRMGQLPIGRCFRFDGPKTSGGISLGGTTNLNVSVNKKLFLCGVGVFGRKPKALEKYGTATIRITLKNEAGTILAEETEKITFDGTNKIYEIVFKVPVLFESSKIYNIEDYSDGPNDVYESFYGIDGKTEIEENGVELKLSMGIRFPVKNVDPLTMGRLASFIFRC